MSTPSKRLGFVGIILSNRDESARKLNSILSDYGHIIEGRMGRPYRERGCWAVVLLVDATTDELGALTGRLGQIPGITVKSALAPA